MTWVPQSCTLPTAEQPLRIAEFDALFAGALRAVERPAPTSVRLVLDRAADAVARELADREAGCCSFFTFVFDHDAAGRLLMDIAVPEAHADVLEALADRARGAQK
ncbi:hypothetical protein [Yinghuangia sp. YIM S09857]|uniref:hypothetical protein n=1 Tax=Yinghuangia sp. YIM S09857 TaxID=3436929 RepID=UPI003F52DF01